MKQVLRKLLVFFMIVQLFSSCMILANKDRYVSNFERFVKNVEKNADMFKPKDWRWADKRYHTYSVDWYQKFRAELTLQDQIRIASLKIRFQAVKDSRGFKRRIDEQISKDLEKMGEDVGKYLDENLDRDLEKLSKGARAIGDSALKVVEDLLMEIRKKKE